MRDALTEKINSGLTTFLKDADKKYGFSRLAPSFYEYAHDFIFRGGKRIRPVLFTLAYLGLSRRRKPPAGLYACAASIELLHDYMLIHDDVIDRSLLRRGKPTLHKLFDKNPAVRAADIGASLAIVSGDILYALAVEAVLAVDEDKRRKEDAVGRLAEAAVSTALGEFIDVTSSHKPIETMREEDILTLYTLKTARYTFECPLVMGALLAGAEKNQTYLLSRLALAAGCAFQIRDDFLDLFSTQKQIGKSILTDLSESKKTLLAFFAYQNLTGGKKRIFKNILEGNKKKTKAALETFRGLIVESGSYERCLEKMRALGGEALALCDTLKMRDPYRATLQTLISKAAAEPF